MNQLLKYQVQEGQCFYGSQDVSPLTLGTCPTYLCNPSS